ncbi:hypothetical protein [Streptomyces sp. NBC_00557]|uniref:hypothetical protein n=1 Tax=Streptomyces sp. NBC_00557 TaxID=2975776 RepID=UPI002E819D9E|nr:hypothetical protein [Streptomyces sp. NBC_00557]WUC39379.1 hypothetical protein OG956_36820 [Streptomyces sp. NBC_00557]
MASSWGPAVLRAAGRAGGWLGLFAAGSFVATGFTLATAWPLLALWSQGHRNPMAFFLACGGVVVALLVPGLSAVYLHSRGREKASYVIAGGIGLLMVSAYGFVLHFGQQDSDQQALHDRGVAVTGVVTRQWKSSTPDGTSSGVVVRLPDGTTHQLRGEQSPTGTRVVVTVDPRGHVDERLGPPPGAPDGVALKLSAAGVALGCVASSACCAGFLTEDIRRPLRRRGPARGREDRAVAVSAARGH